MTTLTVQVDETLLQKTQALAKAKEASLDEFVLDLLKTAVDQNDPLNQADSPEERGRRWDDMMEQFGKYDTGGPFTRDELNER